MYWLLELIGKTIAYGIAASFALLLGFALVTGLLDFASTAFGSFILLLIGVKLMRDYYNR